jgi:hypothetical protein
MTISIKSLLIAVVCLIAVPGTAWVLERYHIGNTPEPEALRAPLAPQHVDSPASASVSAEFLDQRVMYEDLGMIACLKTLKCRGMDSSTDSVQKCAAEFVKKVCAATNGCKEAVESNHTVQDMVACVDVIKDMRCPRGKSTKVTDVLDVLIDKCPASR